MLARSILRFLSSLRLGIVLIALMAISCIAGSLIASNENMGVDHGREYVFHTWWFLGVMGLLLVNLCLCSWEKSYIALTLYKKKNIIANPAFYRKAGHSTAFAWNGSVGTLGKILKKKYTVVHQREGAFYAQKGLFGRCGATIIHIGLLWTMMAGYYRILADDLGWGVYDSTVILPEGQLTDSYFTRIDRLKGPVHSNLREKKMPFSLRAVDFNAEYYPHSTVAKSFASLVEIKDGSKSMMREVTMTNPLAYKGYKITQNSFSPNERVARGKFRVRDVQSGDQVDLDAVPGDPVRLRLAGADGLFFQPDGLESGSRFYVLNLASQKIIESGMIESPAASGSLPINTEKYQDQLANSKYAYLIAAMFPNFTFDENQQPTTKDETFANPAVLLMLYKNGKPNGYTWLFHNADAQEIMGQPHPELSMKFVDYRQISGAAGAAGLYDYKMEVEFQEKETSKTVGRFWAPAGNLQELDVSPELLARPNISQDPLPAPHGSPDALSSSTASLPGGAAPSTVSGGSPPPSDTSRYEVTYLGPTTGNVTFLGYMKDPSVAWIFAGCIVVIAGTLVAFMFVYRETWVYYDEEQRMLHMATAVRGTSPGAHREFDRLVAQMAAAGAPP